MAPLPAYVIAEIDVHDPDTYAEYVALVQATVDPFEGRYLVRSENCENLEGDWLPKRLIVLEFPTAEHARGWYESADYVKAAAIRQRSSTGSLILAHSPEP
jgi:uncharacterized protein (DUF1330 family)